ncbi:hypothetical protein [Cerasicoccus maritimus]|uniref:hypothetical protein n=1 Tax=Cerasicoccus maritimus TaxID=490089 RepID=UPI002852A129|nr:hypothetical protein [Cerasicoccus maritimus]
METPSYLVETYYNTDTQETRTSSNSQDYAQTGEIIVDTYFINQFDAGQTLMTISTEGVYTGSDFSGQILDFSRGRVLAKDSDETLSESVPVFVNNAQDVLITSDGFDGGHELNILIRKPDSLSEADLDGAWTIGTATIPAVLYESYYNSDSDSNRSATNDDFAQNGEQLVDLHRSSEFESFWGGLTISSGSFSGLFSGSITPSSLMAIVTPDDEDASPMTFSINQNKDVMVYTDTDEDSESIELVILARKPSTLNLADLEGTWRVASLLIPVELKESYYNSDSGVSRTGDINDFATTGEQFVDIYYTSEFETEQGSMEIDASGNATGLIAGAFTVESDNTLTFTDSEGSAPVFINASKNFAYNISLDSQEMNIHVLTKVSSNIPDTFEEKVDVRLVEVDGETVITLNGGDNLKVVESSTLGDSPTTWSEVDSPQGTSIVTPSTSGQSAKFYSVTPRTDETD